MDVQERWGREYAARQWPGVPIEVFADKGKSASKRKDERPEYERLLAWVKAGRVGQVWAVEQSRLQRDELRWFEFRNELLHADITELHTNRNGVVDVESMAAGVTALTDAEESRRIRKRTRDGHNAAAREGRPPGARPFGYRHAGGRKRGSDSPLTYEIVPEQAEALRKAASLVLDGWSLSSIAAALRADGVTGSHGGRLAPTTVRVWLTSPSLAGWRVHRGEVVGKGNWPAILDEATWQAVQAKLAGPRVVRQANGGEYPVTAAHRTVGGRPRRYALSGLAVCAVCDAVLMGSLHPVGKRRPEDKGTPDTRERKPYLMCHVVRQGRGCVAAPYEPVLNEVLWWLWAELDKPEFLDLVAADAAAERRDEITAQLTVLGGQRRELARMWAAPGGSLTSEEWQAARDGLDEQEQALRAELRNLPTPVERVTADEAREAWPDMTLDEQQEFLRRYIAEVRLSKAGRRGERPFDTNRVVVVPRDLG